MSKNQLLEVTVVGNKAGGTVEYIENKKDPERVYHVMVKQGNRRAHLLGDLEFISEIEYKPGDVIKGARILVKEQLEPFEPSDPILFLKKKEDGSICRKDGKPIYQKKYFTHDKKKTDIIIQED